MIGARTFEPPPRATITLPPEPEHGPIVTPIDWSAGDRAIAQYFWTSTDKDADAWTCDIAEVQRVLNFGMKAMPVPHGTPSGHGQLTVHVERIALPIAEQMLRHRVQVQSPDGDGMGWLTVEWSPNISKKSYRYVPVKKGAEGIGDIFYLPQPEDLRIQEGRPGAYTYSPMDPATAEAVIGELRYLYIGCWEVYERIRKTTNLAPEQARFFLPTGLYTRMYATASYRNWLNWLVQRNDAHAQAEIQQVAVQVEAIIAQCIPLTYGLWLSHGRRVI
jgi:thymidylate synthase ThyX